jgi:Methylamine utilisation protein MauE
VRSFSLFCTFIRWFFVALLLASAIGKLLDIAGFYGVVATYQLLPIATIPVAAWLLVALELTLGIWLASNRMLQSAALVLVGLHMIYFAWLMVALVRGLTIPNCGCFGVFFARPLTWTTLLEDGMLIVLAIVLWRHAALTTVSAKETA